VANPIQLKRARLGGNDNATHRWGWKVFEAQGVEPVFPEKVVAEDVTIGSGALFSSRWSSNPISVATRFHRSKTAHFATIFSGAQFFLLPNRNATVTVC